MRDTLLLLAAIACMVGGFAHFLAPPKTSATPPETSPFPAAHTVVRTDRAAAPTLVAVSDESIDPDIAEARRLLSADPDDHEGHAFTLLASLCQDGKFPLAVQLAGEAPSELRDGWLKFVFTRWGQSHPTDALQALEAMTDPEQRTAAFQAAVSGWNSQDPAALADYAHQLAPGADHDFALKTALENWSLQDPAALGAWLNTLPPGSEFDRGAALMLTRTDGVNRSPEVAAKWIEAIGDPDLKVQSLARLVTEWSQTDAPAARQYLANAAWLDDSARARMLDTLSETPKADQAATSD